MLRLFHITTATAVRLSYEHYFEKKNRSFRRAAKRPPYEIMKLNDTSDHDIHTRMILGP